MVPPSSLRIPRVRRYSGYCRFPCRFAYEAVTLSCRASHPVRLQRRITCAVHTPQVFLPTVWPLPLSLATTRGISFDFSSSGYLDVSVPRVPLVNLCIQLTIYDSSSYVFPHSDICGSMLICSSPQLFAACHVLHRLPMPRHSPYALISFTFCIRKNFCVCRIFYLTIKKTCFSIVVLLLVVLNIFHFYSVFKMLGCIL